MNFKAFVSTGKSGKRAGMNHPHTVGMSPKSLCATRKDQSVPGCIEADVTR